MSTQSAKNINAIKDKFQDLLTEKSEKEGIEHDALLLMASYLSEIERIQKEKNIKRNKLADMIKITPSYLTQVFRGSKPLNFYTLAKIQRVLNIKFFIEAKDRNSLILNEELDFSKYYGNLSKPQFAYFNKSDTSTNSQASSGTLFSLNSTFSSFK